MVLRLQTIKTIINSCKFKGSSYHEPRRVQVLDLYCLTRFESENSRRGVREVVEYTTNVSYKRKKPEDLGNYPRQPFRLYRLISGCANNKDIQNRTPLFSN